MSKRQKKPLNGENGIHRAHLWEILFYDMNNISTNFYAVIMATISYYLIGVVGVAAVLAGSLVTIMRVWDGVTDPIVGLVVDKTNGKFGKNRPFIVIGQVIMLLTSILIFRVIPNIPTEGRFIAYIIFYLCYIIGYTCQCVVTKSAQSCITNDPEQRPLFSMFDSVFQILVFTVAYPIYTTSYLVPKYTYTTATHADEIAALIEKSPNLANVLIPNAETGVSTLSAYYNPLFFQEMHLTFAVFSIITAIMAVIGLWRKDRIEYYGVVDAKQQVRLRDYWDVLKHNRAIQMLVVAAGSDKLAQSIFSNSTVAICVYAVICGNYSTYSAVSAITAVPIVLISIFGIRRIACRMGQKQSLYVGSIGAIFFAVLFLLLFVVGDPSSLVLPTFSLTKPSTWLSLFNVTSWSGFGVLYILLYILMRGSNSLASTIVIPMTGDCADYEVYRTGRYVPGLMGTLFSFVDKIISSFATTIVALVYASIGFTVALPTVETPASDSLFVATLFLFVGIPIIGWVLNVICMHFYPLDKKKMEEIEASIAEMKKNGTIN